MTNEIQLGYPIQVVKKISLLPQIGFGAMGEAVHTNYCDGYTDADLFVDLSLTSAYHFDAFGIGPIINYEMNLSDQRGNMLSDNRLLFSIVIMK